MLKFLISTPAAKGSTRGNRITALRWSRILRNLGHQVVISDHFDGMNPSSRGDCLVALHAVRSSESVFAFHKDFPDRPILLCLTGTDIHRDLAGERGEKNQQIAIHAMEIADRLILIEPECKQRLPVNLQDKTTVIYQSAMPVKNPSQPLKSCFEVTCVAHLRVEKDPFRIAMAARKLPAESRIKIKHIGSAYSDPFKLQAETHTRNNSRYQWLGERSHAVTQRLLARSRLTVLTSRCEGGPSVFSEAIVNGVPILATRIDASIGMLGRNYPGLFDVGDTANLTSLLFRSETDSQFYGRLKTAIGKLKTRFQRDVETATWQAMISDLKFG